MGPASLLLPLVIIQSISVSPFEVLQGASDKHVKEKDYINPKLRRRELSCAENEYNAENHCCKKCREGTHVRSDCENPHENPLCDDCLPGTYMDKDNGFKECHRCQDCQPGSGQEVLHGCTSTTNTVCQCAKGFFCKENMSSHDGGCHQCLHCTECDNGEAEQCTPIKDAVCNSPRSHMAACIAVTLFIILAIAILCTVVIFRKKPPIYQPEVSPDPPQVAPGFICPPHLEDIDFEKYLHEIAGKMDKNSVLGLSRKCFSAATIEEIQCDNPEALEQKYSLLKAWYRKNGQQGTFKYLVEHCDRLIAQAIVQLVERERAEIPV